MLKPFKKPASAITNSMVIKKMIECAYQTPYGCFVEVGVYKGGSAFYLNEIATKQKRKLYLYDTFEGMPYKSEMDKHEIGDFKDTDFKSVKKLFPKAIVIKGIFPSSAIEMNNIAFVHLDCDQYQSYLESLVYLKDKMINGGMIWMDDYDLKGCRKAVEETIEKHINVIGRQAYIAF